MKTINKFVLFSGVYFVCYLKLCSSQSSVTIGALFHEDNQLEELAFKHALFQKNIFNNDFKFKATIQRVPKDDPFAVSKIICNMTNSEDGIVAIFGPLSYKTAAMAQSISEKLEIPHLQVHLKYTAGYRGKVNLNFHPDPIVYSEALAAVVKSMHWKSYAIVYEDPEALIRLQEVLKITAKKDSPVTVKQLGANNDYRPLLKEIKNATVNHIILDCKLENTIHLLHQAHEVGMLEIYNSFLLTSLDSHTLDFNVLETLANITTIRLVDPKNRALEYAVRNWEVGEHRLDFQISPEQVPTSMALTHDAATFFMESYLNLHYTRDVRPQRLNCDGSDTWVDGLQIAEFLKTHDMQNATTIPTTFENRSLNFWFDELGSRKWVQFQIVEIINGTKAITGIWDPTYGQNVNITRSESEQEQTVRLTLQKTTVIVSSRIGPPYLMHKAEKPDGEPRVGNDRYEGYSMDLIREIANELNFTFKFVLTKDGQYGKYDPITKSWNGLVKDLLENKAHLAICDLTITHQRREAVDFSMPFMTLGVSILHKKPPVQSPNIFAFMAPLEFEVWIYIATLYLGTSIALYVIARMAPGDWENPHPCNQNPDELENIWTVKNCLWLNLGSIMQQGCDILPKGISSRMGASLWWFFSLIITSSYTANLAAFLTTDRMVSSINNAEDLVKQTKIKYGLVEGGATESFFKETNFTAYHRMWTQMLDAKPKVFEKDNNDGVKRVLSTHNEAFAFLMESSQIEYEIERNCSLKQVGERLDSKGYGIAMPMNAPYRSAINSVILKLQESGKLNDLKTKWWKTGPEVQNCTEAHRSSDGKADALALANVGGVFLLLGVSIGVAIGMAFLEFLWNVRNVSVQEHISYCDALFIEIKFAINICNTKKRVRPILDSQSSSEHSETKSVAQRVLQGAGSFLRLDVFDRVIKSEPRQQQPPPQDQE